MLIIVKLVNRTAAQEDQVNDLYDMPGHLARRFQQIAVAIFHAEVRQAGFELTPVQYAALVTVAKNAGIDQATLAGLIAYDRATIGGVVDRLEQKGYLARHISGRDRRARELEITDEGRRALRSMEPAVEVAQQIMLRGLTRSETTEFLRLLRKTISATNELSRAPLRRS
jgi:DNA-binding MarR family transcriptional regulator